MNNKKTAYIIVSILVAIVLFYAGVLYGKSGNPAGQMAIGTGNFNRTGGAGMMGGNVSGRPNTKGNTGAMRGGFALGSVLSISQDGKSMTLKLANGGSQIVFLSASTTVSKSAPATRADLIVNANVNISGKANSDGSVTADVVQIR